MTVTILHKGQFALLARFYVYIMPYIDRMVGVGAEKI